MSGGSKTTTTQTQNNEPYKAAQPGLDWGMGQALSLAKQGNLAKPLTMSTVVPFSQQSMAGMNAIQGNANAAMAPGGYSQQWGDIIRGKGYNDAQTTAMEGIKNTATGAFDVNANPAFQSVLKQAQDSALGAANQNASGLGRYGSAAHQSVATRDVGDLTSRMVGDEYHNWQGRQDAAQRDLFNMGQAGQGNLQNAFERQNDPAQALMGVGSAYEDLYSRQLNDSLRIADETQNQPRNNLRELMALLGGAGQFGTSTQTAQGPSNTFSNILGGGLGIAGLLQGL